MQRFWESLIINIPVCQTVSTTYSPISFVSYFLFLFILLTNKIAYLYCIQPFWNTYAWWNDWVKWVDTHIYSQIYKCWEHLQVLLVTFKCTVHCWKLKWSLQPVLTEYLLSKLWSGIDLVIQLTDLENNFSSSLVLLWAQRTQPCEFMSQGRQRILYREKGSYKNVFLAIWGIAWFSPSC